ncbi:hypothetical protein SHKM778_78840 [Streptomyces sp. KM77-8]|uniref:Uncharacterized protein n=1 Tax=Streptomyces haneummycinicus TaxID=3074435 RepID=A0AAT9HV04_9ACTN
MTAMPMTRLAPTLGRNPRIDTAAHSAAVAATTAMTTDRTTSTGSYANAPPIRMLAIPM